MLTPNFKALVEVKMDFRIKVFAQTQSFVFKFVAGNVNTFNVGQKILAKSANPKTKAWFLFWC